MSVKYKSQNNARHLYNFNKDSALAFMEESPMTRFMNLTYCMSLLKLYSELGRREQWGKQRIWRHCHRNIHQLKGIISQEGWWLIEYSFSSATPTSYRTSLCPMPSKSIMTFECCKEDGWKNPVSDIKLTWTQGIHILIIFSSWNRNPLISRCF